MTDEPRRTGGPGFADAVTYSWADPQAEIYGFARLGIADGQGSALAVLFSGREPAGVIADGGLEVPAGEDWSALAMGGVAMDGSDPSWTLAASPSGRPVELRFEATGPRAEIGEEGDLARAGGMAGFEQPCRVTGSVTLDGRRVAVDGVGQRGHQWGAPDWERIALARTLSAWTSEGHGVALGSVRPRKAKSHADEALWASLLGPEAVRVADPRLSTTYDDAGRQRRAGLELWVGDEDPFPHRASGEVLCGSTLDLGQLRLDCAFFRWSLDGEEAVGRYDILRRA
jgi:hypothetical protein